MTVYIGARDLNGLPVGTHQFIVITFNSPQTIILGGKAVSARTLGPKTHGIVIGAQNRGSLNVEAFEVADTLAAREFLGGLEKKWYESDYDAELHIVRFNGTAISPHGEKKLISLINAYITNQILTPFDTQQQAQALIVTAGHNQQLNMLAE